MASHEGDSILAHPELDSMVRLQAQARRSTLGGSALMVPHRRPASPPHRCWPPAAVPVASQITRLKKRQGLTEKEVARLCTKAKEVLADEQVPFESSKIRMLENARGFQSNKVLAGLAWVSKAPGNDR